MADQALSNSTTCAWTMQDVQHLVGVLQDALGVTIEDKGQILLNISDGLYRNAEFRIQVKGPPKPVETG
jgi:hypothetical protein